MLCVLTTAWAPGCGSSTELSTVRNTAGSPCTEDEGSRQACTTSDGCSGSQTCSDEEWSACICQEEGESRGAAARIQPVECGGNILQGDLGARNNWIGGEATSGVDDPCGIQGPIYAYGDEEEATAAGLPSSCAIPNDPRATISCDDARCCISGYSIEDRTYAAWGCGIGIGLKHDAEQVRLPYDEPGVIGFRYSVEGSLTEGQYIRVHLKQPGSTEKSCGPFQGGSSWAGSPIDAALLAQGPFQSSLLFEEALCSMDARASCGCTTATPTPLDIQFQVTGAYVNGPFEFCLTELSPIVVPQERETIDAGAQ